jgi:hypothetical protein
MQNKLKLISLILFFTNNSFSQITSDTLFKIRSGFQLNFNLTKEITDFNIKKIDILNRDDTTKLGNKQYQFITDLTFLFFVPYQLSELYLEEIKNDFIDDINIVNYNVIVVSYLEEKYEYLNTFNGAVLNRPSVYVLTKNKVLCNYISTKDWLFKDSKFVDKNYELFHLKIGNCNTDKYFADYKNLISELINKYTFNFVYPDILNSLNFRF